MDKISETLMKLGLLMHPQFIHSMDAINFILELKRREIKMDIGESQRVFLSPVQG
jgi:hypothetical protein